MQQRLDALANDVGRVAQVGGSLAGSSDMGPVAEFSRALDEFFAGRLKEEIESGNDPRWQLIYTIFAGGDDLVMVGPWDVMLDFAGRMRELFHAAFGGRGLTVSAGLALVKPKRPIKAAVEEAGRLLEQAKTRSAPGEAGPKDQFACLGQVWKWKDHATILREARRLVGWVDESGQMQRGWLHTLLGLAEARQPHVLLRRPNPESRPDALATARLANHVERNYARYAAVLKWGRFLVKRFDDDPAPAEVRYLPAILRYALTATRTPGEEE